jgi:dCMP deaminase
MENMETSPKGRREIVPRKFSHLKELEYIIEAVRISFKSNMRSKHGSIIVKNGKIISQGYNRYVGINWSHNSEIKGKNRGKYSIHAEEDALRNADPMKLSGASMYVIRWGSDPDDPLFMNSMPCLKCEKKIRKAMEKYGLKNVFYSVDMDITVNELMMFPKKEEEVVEEQF